MIGQTLDRYRIESTLGEGGMGVVYLARDTQRDRSVAVKVLLSEEVADAARKQRFVQRRSILGGPTAERRRLSVTNRQFQWLALTQI